ncbi:MAG: hemolysin III family protein [Pirellulaceae bacterium]|nr:hemolysin III family protein [Pirellulaceae bacterium]
MSSQTAILNTTGALRTPASALRTPGEESVAAATHGFGLLLSLAGSAALLHAAWSGGDPWCLASCCFYALTLVAVYAASTASHLYLPERLNRTFRALDQGFIYLLIVGTLAPFILTKMRTPFGMSFFGLVLALACAGFLSKTVWAHRLEGVAVWLYIGLGWGEALAFRPMVELMPVEGLYWVVAGGLCYTLGTVFLVWDIRRYHFHAIWHLLVIAGSACHFVAIYRYVVLS